MSQRVETLAQRGGPGLELGSACAQAVRSLLQLGGPSCQPVDAGYQFLGAVQQGAQPVVEPGGAIDELGHGVGKLIQLAVQAAQPAGFIGHVIK